VPYDPAERCWKINVVDASGQSVGGYMDPDELSAQGTPAWMSRPRATHFEVMWQLAPDRFVVLFRFNLSGKWEFTDRDYFQELTNAQAVKWFEDEGYPVPAELRGAFAPMAPRR
jgi:hypothetical protein